MPEVQELFRMATQKVRPDTGYVDRQHEHSRRRERRRRIEAFIAVAAIVAVVGVFGVRTLDDGRPRRPADTAPPVIAPSVPVPSALGSDYVLDLHTGEATPLARSIVGAQFAASPDGAWLAYVANDDVGSPQVFIADIDGSGIQQVTHDPVGATWPAWSPDATSIAYVGHGDGNVANLFVLGITTGESTQVTHRNDGTLDLSGPTFAPDGSSLIYSALGTATAEIRMVPVGGGRSTMLFGRDHGGMEVGGGSMSPDGSLVTMTGNEVGGPGAALFVSNVDGSQRRAFGAYGTTPAGTWSPDGSRIVARSYEEEGSRIIVIDIASGTMSRVAKGSAAIWLDDHTLLVEG